jgi:hypothetical protein
MFCFPDRLDHTVAESRDRHRASAFGALGELRSPAKWKQVHPWPASATTP